MTLHLTGNRAGFPIGLTEVTRHDEATENTGIGFSVLRLSPGETWRATPEGETAYMLMSGRARLAAAGREAVYDRRSLFDESRGYAFPCE